MAGPSNLRQDLNQVLKENFDQGANLVSPLAWCPHLEKVDKDFDPSQFDVQKKCGVCDNVGENWICLECHQVFCSRFVQEHMVVHGAESGHLLTLSFSDLSVWCYGCEDYVDNEVLYEFKNALHKNKFNGEGMPRPNAIVLE